MFRVSQYSMDDVSRFRVDRDIYIVGVEAAGFVGLTTVVLYKGVSQS